MMILPHSLSKGYGAFFPELLKHYFMAHQNNRWFSQLLSFLSILMLLGSHSAGEKKHYLIESGSKLYLKGTSNVNKFTCDCEDQYDGQILEAERNGGYVRYRNVDLILKSKNFDCHNRKIDKDMQKALKADDYPYIKVSLIDTWQDPKCLNSQCQDWFDVKANVKITIANVTKTQSIDAKAKVLGSNRFQLQGQSPMQMSAFGIEPPEALMGMIKVNDWITFHFELIVRVDEVQ